MTRAATMPWVGVRLWAAMRSKFWAQRSYPPLIFLPPPLPPSQGVSHTGSHTDTRTRLSRCSGPPSPRACSGGDSSGEERGEEWGAGDFWNREKKLSL
jgi:hypothetical protein